MLNEEKSRKAGKNAKILHIVLWVAQILLAVMMLMAGFMKATTPIVQLSETLSWAKEVPEALVRFIGIAEVLAWIGLLLPSILRVKPHLSPLAAVGLIAIMLMAAIFHASRGEYQAVPINLVFVALASFIAWGRYKKVPIVAK